jgi:hypothetical protein
MVSGSVDKKRQALEAAKKLRSQAIAIERLAGGRGGGTTDADRKAAERKSNRDLSIPEIKDPARRAACEADDLLWLETYLPDVFYNPFTAHQRKIIADCGESLLYGTQKCKAAPRGDGKSSIVKYLGLKYALARQVSFPLIIAATSSKSKKTLGSLKRRLASRSDSPLSEDYPLECHTARYVDPWPSRARNVTANGQRPIHVEWGADWFILPTWEDEEPLGPIILSLGITSDDLQGCNIYDRRPDFVMLDDLDSRDSLAAEDGVVAGKIEEAVDKTVAGLGGQSRRLGQFMLCTITSRDAAAYKYSDPKQKPAWSGERIAAITKWPERLDLWDTYIELRKWGKETLDEDGQPADVFGRKAHQHYLDNREAMDLGAELSNPYNFEPELLPDGSQKQVSSLQRCYDYISDSNMESFQTEHQNDPPNKEEFVDSGLTAGRVQRQVSGFDQYIVPAGCTVLVQGIDVGKLVLHWVVKAFRPDGTGFVIDYGRYETVGTTYNSEEGLDVAIKRAVIGRMEQAKETQYVNEAGEIMPIDLTLVDAGYRELAVMSACAEIGLGIRPVMGCGKSNGCARLSYPDYRNNTENAKRGGDKWCESRQGRGAQWLILAFADYWKAWEHDRWMTDPSQPGSMMLFGQSGSETRMSPDQKSHTSFAHHIDAEKEVEEVIKGVLKRYWKKTPGRGQNHFLDASYYANVAANMKGIRIMTANAEKRANPADRPSARDLAARKRA